jgi:hypothetical protein
MTTIAATILVAPGLAQPRHVADVDARHVLHQHRNAIRLGQDDVLDVVDAPALGQILRTAAVDQADAADVHRLLADVDGAPAHVDVRVADRGDDLRHRHPIGIELVEIDLDFIFLGGAAPGVDLDHARHGEQPALQHPVLDRAQVGQAEVRWADQLVAIDFANQARCLNLRGDAVGKIDVLLQAERGLREGEVIIDAVFERDSNERQAVERGGTDVVDAGRGRESDLHRNGVIALHFLGGESRRLGGDLQDHRRRIGIGLDVEPGEGEEPAGDEHQQTQQNDRAPRQSEGEDRFDHGWCPDSEVRPSYPHAPKRTSESKDTSNSMILVPL